MRIKGCEMGGDSTEEQPEVPPNTGKKARGPFPLAGTPLTRKDLAYVRCITSASLVLMASYYRLIFRLKSTAPSG